MKQFILGFIFGFILCSIGVFSGASEKVRAWVGDQVSKVETTISTNY